MKHTTQEHFHQDTVKAVLTAGQSDPLCYQNPVVSLYGPPTSRLKLGPISGGTVDLNQSSAISVIGPRIRDTFLRIEGQ